MRLPSGDIVEIHTPVYPGSNFTWGEVTKNFRRPLEDLIIDGQLLCNAQEIEKRIISTAKHLDEARALLGGHPLKVNSWYRPSKENARVGGAKYSRHLFGDGVDICSNYIQARKMYKKLNKWHGVTGGLGSYYSFVHIDRRGQKARWRG